ncbi:MAG: divergent polysaccharide deacetylase family protein [Armatimonadetes bacterium]|nr:divergent polysaccharide deacetylase family protein [Armatimonadota bacterium]
MANKKKPARRPSGLTGGKLGSLFWLLAIVGLMIISAVLYFSLDLSANRKHHSRNVSQAQRLSTADSPLVPRPKPTDRPRSQGPRITNNSPKIAIIIDDLGYSLERALPFLGLPCSITLSVLPSLPYSAPIARKAKEEGKGVMMHLPMESKTGKEPGPGAVTMEMPSPELRQQIAEDLESVPGATGVNNHMGSLGSEDRALSRRIMEYMKERDLFFIDSRTSPDSVLGAVALECGVRCLCRAIFLDHEDQPDRIREKLVEAADLALKQGMAVAIGHPRPNTALVLQEAVTLFSGKGVQLITADDLWGE